MILVNMSHSYFILFICLCTFTNANLVATASILQGTSQAYTSWKDSSYHIKPSDLHELNFKQTHNATNAVLLQNKSDSGVYDGLYSELQEKISNNTNATYVTQMFYIGAAKRGKRDAVDLITPKSRGYKKLIKENNKFPRISKLDADRKDSRSRKKKSKRRRKNFTIPLPYPNVELNPDGEYGNKTLTNTDYNGPKIKRRKNRKRHRKLNMPLPFPNGEAPGANDTITSKEEFQSPSENPKKNNINSNIGINVLTAAENKGGPKIKRVKRHKIKKVKIPLPYNPAPKISSKEQEKDEKDEEQPKIIIRNKRHRKHKGKRPPPLN